jgi:cbb3-type cytochrome oxidase subunit 3
MNMSLNMMINEWLPLMLVLFMAAMFFMYIKSQKRAAEYIRRCEDLANRTLQIQENILQELKKISSSFKK